MNDILPQHIMKFFVDNPNIGRGELSKKAGISESDARFYCKLFKEKQKDIEIVDVGIGVWDLHHPYHDDRAFNCLIKVIKDLKPSIFILGGDNMDFNTISAYNKHKPKLIEGSRLSRDYKRFNGDILYPLEQLLGDDCKKYFMKGNHEERVNRLIESEPKLEGLIEVENNLDLSKWKTYEYKEVLTIGHMNFIHGIYWNKYHSNKTVSVYEKNIFYGHVHTPQIFTTISPIDSLPKQGVSVGCMCQKNPHYKENQPNHWVNQFLVFYILSDGTFRYVTPTIIHGRMILNGKLYDGN